MSDSNERSIKQRLVNTQKTIKKKFKEAFKDRVEKERALKSTFKPVTRKIDELIELSGKQNSSSQRQSSENTQNNVSSAHQIYEESSEESGDGANRYNDDSHVYDTVAESDSTSMDDDIWSADGDESWTTDAIGTKNDFINNTSLVAKRTRAKATRRRTNYTGRKESLVANRTRSKATKRKSTDAADDGFSIPRKKIAIDVGNDNPSPMFERPILMRKTTKRITTRPLTEHSRLLTIQPGTCLINNKKEADAVEMKQSNKRRVVKRFPKPRESIHIKDKLKKNQALLRESLAKHGKAKNNEPHPTTSQPPPTDIVSTKSVRLSQNPDLYEKLVKRHGNVFKHDDEVLLVDYDDGTNDIRIASPKRRKNLIHHPRKRTKIRHLRGNLSGNSGSDSEGCGSKDMSTKSMIPPIARPLITDNEDGVVLGSGIETDFIPYRRNANIIYEYFDNPNELCARLRLLVSSQLAGNTNHSQEINSIVQEIRELGLIK